MWTLANILWAVVVILVALWLIALLVPGIGFSGNALIHVLLVVAILIVLYNLFVGRRAI